MSHTQLLAASLAPCPCADAAKCVMQVDEEAGLDTQPASSGDVAGCDEDLFTEEARDELLSESLSEGTVVRIVGLHKRWGRKLPVWETPQAKGT